MSMSNWSALRHIPVSILTGFLGAGKTTLINRLIGTPFLADAALIINEFGDVGIDHLLVEQSGDDVIELSDGCLCCTVRGELVDTLSDLADRAQTGKIKPFSRVIIETTGLADPLPVMQAVIGHPVLQQCYRLEGIVSVIDAVNGLSTLSNHEEARRQVAVADRLVLTKQHLADAANLETASLRSRLADLNPLAPIIDSDVEALDPVALFDCGAYDPSLRSMNVRRWLGAEDLAHTHSEQSGHDHSAHSHHHHGEPHAHDINRHGDDIRSDSFENDEAISPLALGMFMDLLRSAHGPNLLRMKGLVKLADDPSRPLVIHAVQALASDPVRLPRWPEGSTARTRIVVITRGMPAGFISDLFGAFVDQPAIGRPDSQALMDNPLAIPGAFKPRR